MRDIANHLVKYSFPQVPVQEEEVISCLKQREINIDGYDLMVYFNKCKYHDIEMETLQIFGKSFTFLPFSVVCKAARKFLGNKELSYVEVMHHRNKDILDEYSRKIYVWTVYYDNGEVVANPFITEFEHRTYDGLNFSHINKNQIKFL